MVTGVISTLNQTYSLAYDSISIRKNATHYKLIATYHSTSTDYLIATYKKLISSVNDFNPLPISGGFKGTRATPEEYVFAVFYDIESSVTGILSPSAKSSLQSAEIYKLDNLDESLQLNQSI